MRDNTTELRKTYDALVFEKLLYQQMIIRDVFKQRINALEVHNKLAEKRQVKVDIDEDDIIFVRALFGRGHRSLGVDHIDDLMSYWECEDFTDQLQPVMEVCKEFRFQLEEHTYDSSIELLNRLNQKYSAVVIEVPIDDEISPFAKGCFGDIQATNKAVVMQYTRKTVTLFVINQQNLKTKISFEKPTVEKKVEKIEDEDMFRYRDLIEFVAT